jgi:N-acetylmuramic acid 6-phosphate etherase
VEFAEDDVELGAKDVQQAQVSSLDVVILLAASGATPYVLGALRAARSAGALTIGLANNTGAPVTREAEIGITLDTGPEVISGSTRLKAGTAQKIALNSLSSAIMVRLHKVHGNLMVDVQANNHKLRGRAVQLVVRLAGVDDSAAQQALEANGWRVKTAVVALKLGLDGVRADAHLARFHGRLRTALQTAPSV